MLSRFFQRSELAAALGAFRSEFTNVAIFSFVSNLLMLAPTIYMLQVFDRVMLSQSELTLLAVSLITLFLFACMAIAERARSLVLVRAGLRFDDVLSTRVFNASFEASLNQASTVPSRAFQDLLNIRQFLTGQGIFTFFDAPWTPIYLAVIFFLHPWMGVLGIVFAVIQGSIAWFGHRRAIAPADAAMRAGIDVNTYVQAKLRNVDVIESMGMLDGLRRRWRGWQDAFMGRSGDAQAMTDRIVSISKFVRYTQQSLSLAAGAVLVIDGGMSPGGMIASNLLMTRALAPIEQLVGVWRPALMARAAFLRLEQLLRDFPRRDPNLRRVPPQGDIALRDVVAVAPGREQPILRGISFEVPAGTLTAIVGPSGSGKSTLARVLVGIWPDVQGEVLLDGMPLADWDRTELGPHLGYLPQDIELFEGTIAENISRFGELDSEKVIEAARTTGLHDMILRFPKGYDTPIGEAGRLLSGGQRQRLGLARAVYGDPKLLVLDEPNANLDDAGEAALARTLQQLKKQGRTVFLVTHRPSALAVVDRVLLLRDGVVQAHGTPQDVLAQLRPAAAPGVPAGPAIDAPPTPA